MAEKVKTRFGVVSVGRMKGQNRFRIQVTLDGKKRQFVAGTVEECIQKYEEFSARCVLGDSMEIVSAAPPPRNNVPTMGQYMREWLDSKINYRDTTKARNKGIIENHILPAFGELRLDELSPNHILEVYQQKLAEYSGSTVLKIHDILNNALTRALKLGIILHNPMDIIDRPRYIVPEMSFYENEQVDVLLKKAQEDMPEIYPLIATAVTTGLRQGELCGLMWKDIDLQRKKLHVRRACLEVNGQQKISHLKTKSSRRTLTILDITCEALENQMSKQGMATYPDAYVFPNTQGDKPMRKRWLLAKWKELTNRAELPYIRFHDLRHTHATWLASEGVPVKTIQARLGHSSISITMDRYSHFSPSSEEMVIQRLNQ